MTKKHIIMVLFFTKTALAFIPPLPPFRKPLLSLNTPERSSLKLVYDKNDIHFQWDTKPRAALWTMGDRVTLFFDQPIGDAPVGGEKELALNTNSVYKNGHVYKGAKDTVFTFNALNQPRLIPHEKGWILQTSESVKSSETINPLKFTVYKDELISSLKGPLCQWTDPTTGIVFHIIPLMEPGFTERHQKGPLHFYQTQQGIVIQAHVRLEENDMGLKIHGLKLSFDKNTSKRVIGQPDNLIYFKDFKGTPKEMKEAHAKLQRHLFNKTFKQDAYFDLVKFYLSIYCFPEALGLLKTMASYQKGEDPLFEAYRGVAALLNHRYDKANQIFDKDYFHHDPEIQLWRGVMLLMQHDHKAGLTIIRSALPLIKSYPLAFRHTIGFMAAKASFYCQEEGDIFLHFVDQKALSPSDKDMFSLLTVVFDKKNDKERRLELLTQLSLSHGQVAVEAMLMILKQHKTITQSDLKTLDDLRFKWRGDETELNVLKTYCQTLLTLKHYAKALIIYRQINEYFSHYPGHEARLKEAQDTFYSVFMDQSMAPLEKITLYHQVIELKPEDERGKKMILSLADAYDALDLIHEAIQVLENSMSSFKDDLYVKASMKLGQLYYLIQKNDEALGRMDDVLKNPISSDIQRDALMMKARIWVDKGDIPKGLSLLTDDHFDVLSLKGQILWQNKMWSDAYDTFKKLMNHGACPPLDRPRFAILQAIALNETGKMTEDLKQELEVIVKNTPFESTLILMTAPDIKGKTHYQEALNELSAAKNFDTSLNDFRQKLGSINN